VAAGALASAVSAVSFSTCRFPVELLIAAAYPAGCTARSSCGPENHPNAWAGEGMNGWPEVRDRARSHITLVCGSGSSRNPGAGGLGIVAGGKARQGWAR